LHRDGQVVWVRDDAQLVAADDGARCWHGVMSDITEQKEAEAELERRAAQHAAVARLGEHALEGASTSDLMQEAITSAAQLLGMEMAAVIEHVAERDRFVFRSTYGLKGNLVNRPIHGGNHSQVGYTVLHGGPIIVTDWSHEQRFGRSADLAEHGAR